MPLLFAQEEHELQRMARTTVALGDGGHVLFTGTVRNFNKSKAVSHLFYEAYDALAVTQFAELEKEACDRFGVNSVLAVHRIGKALVGETAVVIKTSAAHRHQAFVAARFLIDELKKTVAIWKEEHYEDGTSTWDKDLCGCDARFEGANDPALVPVKKAFENQKIDPEKFSQARILLVGAGGLGCPLAINLGALGLRHLSIFDGDIVSKTNLARQFIFARNDVGQNKACVIKNFLAERFSWTNISAHPKFLTQSKVEHLIQDFDLIIDSTDNMKTKIMLAEVSRKAHIPYLCASVYSDEGEVAFISSDAADGCFCCWRQSLEQQITCVQSGVLTHACALVAAYACEKAKNIFKAGDSKYHSELMLITADKGYNTIALTRDPQCQACGPIRGPHELKISKKDKNYT